MWFGKQRFPEPENDHMSTGGDGGGVNDLRRMATRVEQIHIDGELNRTKQDALKKLVEPILRSHDFEETLLNVEFVRRRFYELGLFKNVKVSVDEVKGSGGGTGGVTNLAVTFDVEETRRYAGGIFASGNHNEVSANVELRSPNLFGRGEEIRAQYEHTLRYYSSWSGTFSKPLLWTPWSALRTNLDLTILQLHKHCPWSGHKELNRGLTCGLYIQPSEPHHHHFQWETSWRYLSALAAEPDFEIVQQFGHSLKSSLSHTYTYDLRDNPVLPSRGTLFKAVNEYAGFNRFGAAFRKHELEIQHNIPCFLNLQLSLKGGVMKSFSNVTVSDLFFIGGPMTLRGFQTNAVGRHGERDQSALGATKYWLGAIHIHHPLPFKNQFNQFLRLHGFVNFGSLSDRFEDLRENVRLSYGAGLIFAFGNKIRLELNYCLPVYTENQDKLSNKFQFGIGIDYV